ncbi:BTB/POZ domain-containing protein At3g22104 [Morus notabilis]|uniref:BTB/POZ domain-containing protein At3g22104 n=1 Tax=Morus notabilis TaxID=981085 RepID=UPI000CED1A95|nr:BTB/POZ domain-containing protein At3g22104 [Morus notabilis]
MVISLLCLLNGNSLSFKGSFSIYQVALRVQVGEQDSNMLEYLTGSQLDQATIDHLLIPSPTEKKCIYDVNMILKLVKSFLVIKGNCHLLLSRLNKVGRLIDSFLVEVALDSHMKLSKFSELVMILPDCARESHDRSYQAMDIYFEVHIDLCEEEKIKVCCALNYEKLPTEALKHLARNRSSFKNFGETFHGT